MGAKTSIAWTDHTLSCEPLLESVDLKPWLDVPEPIFDHDGGCVDAHASFLLAQGIRQGLADGPRKIEWVIVGGESGGGARPFEIGWARDIVQQCREAGVACFVKQLGSVPVVVDALDAGPLRTSKRLPVADRRWRVELHDRRYGAELLEFPEDLRVREFPRAASAPA